MRKLIAISLMLFHSLALDSFPGPDNDEIASLPVCNPTGEKYSGYLQINN